MSQRRSRRCSLARGGARNGRFTENCERNNHAPDSNKSGREHPPWNTDENAVDPKTRTETPKNLAELVREI